MRWSRRSIGAETRAELTIACRALDRVFRAGRYWVPQWYRTTHPIAYWDVFAHPPKSCRDTRKASARRTIWWYDAAKAGQARAGEITHERLYRPPHSADDPDAARHPVRLLRRGAVRAGRPGRARDRAALAAPTPAAPRAYRAAAAISARAARSAPPADAVNSKYRGAQGLDPDFIKKPGKAVRLRQAGAGTFCADGVEFRPLRFRQELFPRRQRDPADQGEAAGLDVARHLDDASDLSDLDPARHPQGGAGRLAVRHLDVGGDHRRLCDSRLPVRDPPDHPVRRRLVLQYLPAARPDLGRLGAIPLVLEDHRLFLAHHAAADLDGARRLRHHDAADQELVPRRNPQAICA